MSDNRRKAIAYLNLVLTEGNLYPEEKKDLEQALAVLGRSR